MTLTDFVLQTLMYIGVWSLDPDANTNEENQRGLQDADTLAAIIALNQALQEIFDEGPKAVWEHRFGMPIYPPTPITLNATKYSTAVVITGWQDWMQGCTVQVTGDQMTNEIIDRTTLLRPFMGTTVNGAAATVYCDSLKLPSNIASVSDPIDVLNVTKIFPYDSRETFRYWSGSPRSTDRPPFFGDGAYFQTQKFVGDPRVYIVEAQVNRATGASDVFVRLNPMPGRELTATLIGHVKAPRYTVQDLDDETAEAPVFIPLEEFHESIVLPIMKKRFMAHATFDSELAAQEINNQYASAISRLKTAFKVQTGSPEAQYQ